MASRDLRDAHPVLAEKVGEVMREFARAASPRTLIVTCTYRSPAEQLELYRQGRSRPGKKVTECDGVRKVSMHNVLPARAVDLAVVIDPDGPAGPLKPRVEWDELPEYRRMGEIAESLGLVWGGRWAKFDGPHLQLAPEVV